MDVVMPMYSLLEYSDNYSKTSGSLYQHFRGEPGFFNIGAIVDVNNKYTTDSFNFFLNITCKAGNDSTKNIEIMVR